MQTTIKIKALKYGNRPHYDWKTTLIEKSDTYIFVLAEHGRKLHHHTKKRIFTVPNWTIEFFSFESWFTVSADVMNGMIHQYYCNINMPAIMEGNTVSFVDLDLDLIQRNGRWRVVDEDEFASNAIKYAYPDALIQQAKDELLSLKSRIHNKQFPFDGSMDRYVELVPSTK